MKKYLHSIFAGLLLLGAASTQAATVTLPYSNDFSSSVADFTTSGFGSWSLGGGVYEFSANSAGLRGISVVEGDGIGGATPVDFNFTTSFSVTSSTASNDSWGASLLGDDSTPTTYILTDWAADNTLRIINLGGGGTGTTVNTSLTTTLVTFAENTTYTLTAVGEYTGTDIELTVSISDGINTESLVAPVFDTSLFYDGSAMGLTSRSGSLGAPMGTTVQYNSLTIVPEPTSSAMVLAGAMSLLWARRRRS